MIKRVVQDNNRKMNKIMKSSASTTGQKRQAKIVVLELWLGRELKRWIFSMIKSLKNDQNNSSKDQSQKKMEKSEKFG